MPLLLTGYSRGLMDRVLVAASGVSKASALHLSELWEAPGIHATAALFSLLTVSPCALGCWEPCMCALA